MVKTITNLTFKVTDWTCFLILGILAIVFTKESIDAYSDAKTSWIIEHQPLQNHPTFTLCFGLSEETRLYRRTMTVGQDFDIFFTANSQR